LTLVTKKKDSERNLKIKKGTSQGKKAILALSIQLMSFEKRKKVFGIFIHLLIRKN
jgi:hypothetical protein